MRRHRQDQEQHHDRGDIRMSDRQDDHGDDGRAGSDLPPPPPEDAVVTRDVEQQIREDERQRMHEELEALANDGNGSTTERATPRERRRDRWDELADDPATDTGDINAAALTRDARPGDTTIRADRDALNTATPIGGTPRVEHDRRDTGLGRRDAAGRREYVEEEVVRDRAFSVGQAITLLVGAALTAWGIIALVATGVDTPLDQPVEEVFGFDHTPWMGIGEVAAGVLLILAALRPQGRWLAGLVGAALIAVGVMVVAEMDWTVDELQTEQSFGWIPIIAGALALLGAVLTPPRHQRITETRRVDEYDDR